MKTVPGATAVGMQNCAEDSATLLTQLLDTVKGDFFLMLPLLHFLVRKSPPGTFPRSLLPLTLLPTSLPLLYPDCLLHRLLCVS